MAAAIVTGALIVSAPTMATAEPDVTPVVEGLDGPRGVGVKSLAWRRRRGEARSVYMTARNSEPRVVLRVSG